MPMLELKRLSVQLGAKRIVDGLSFSVSEGQWLMIVGPNGAGKSTVLSAVTQGVPYTGEILFEGARVSAMKPAVRARSIGILAQNHFVGYSFTVEEVVRLGRFAYSAGLFGRQQTDDRAMVERAITMTGLQDKRSQSGRSPAASCSGRFWRRCWRRTRSCCFWTSRRTTLTSSIRSRSSRSSASGCRRPAAPL